MTKRAIALDGVIAPDVPWDALKAAFMDRRWLRVRTMPSVFGDYPIMCNGERHYEVEGNEVRNIGACDCKEKRG
jgi:hypothetical protein